MGNGLFKKVSKAECTSSRALKRSDAKLAISNYERSACLAEVARLQKHLGEAEELEGMLVHLLTDMASKAKADRRSEHDVREWRALTEETIGKLKHAINMKVAEAKMLSGGKKKGEDEPYSDSWW